MVGFNAAIRAYWQAYCHSGKAGDQMRSPPFLHAAAGMATDSDGEYAVTQFGDHPQLANQLVQLVLTGIKTATCSALWEWEAEGCPLPHVGSKTIILDGQAQPCCIIRITDVNLCRFDQVDAEFAAAEGEGDRSLDSWRREHWEYFSRVLPLIGKTPSPEMLLVCERFRVVYTGEPTH